VELAGGAVELTADVEPGMTPTPRTSTVTVALWSAGGVAAAREPSGLVAASSAHGARDLRGRRVVGGTGTEHSKGQDSDELRV
jgi:hypothetical protein